MKFHNIIEICVPIDIAILGIAYPIMVNNISRIGERYNSEYLSNIFNLEFPQRFFRLLLYITFLLLLPLIISFEPPFGWDFIIDLFVLLMTICLTVCFFMWLSIVEKYSGEATTLLRYLIKRYRKKRKPEDDYHLKMINEFAFYAIDKQDEHLQKTLQEFYSQEFSNIRREYDRKKTLTYPIDLYEMVFQLCSKLVNTDKEQLLVLEDAAISGSWFLVDFDHVKISKETYTWLWRILNTIVKKDKFIRRYWSTAHQYYHTKLLYNSTDYEETDSSEETYKERISFLEFHFALGGLLLYQRQYETLGYIFQYTKSQPPTYFLLPNDVDTIFKWFEHFSNVFGKDPIEWRFPFSGIDNYGIPKNEVHWICSYMTLHFIRLYWLHQYYYEKTKDFAQPDLPTTILELQNWLRALPSFEWHLKQLFENKKLLKVLDFEKTVEDNKETFSKYMEKLKKNLEKEIVAQYGQAEISQEKRDKFNESSAIIIKDAFAKYDKIANKGEYTDNENDLKLTVQGHRILIDKSSFMDGTGVDNMNYDLFFAEGIANHHIRRYIPNSFMVAETRRYLLNRSNIVDGIRKIIENKKNVVIVSINLSVENKEILKPFEKQLLEIKGGEYNFKDILFVLDKKNLPFFECKEVDTETVEKEKFKLIDDKLKIYSSILDLSKEENSSAREKWSEEDLNSTTGKLQVTIAFLTLIIYKKSREIVQLNIASEYREQGIENSLDDIQPLQRD